MGLFYNYETAGPGVSKHEKKKPFFRFWELFFNKFGTFFLINMVYFLFCIPIVTIGPATAAMTAMMRNIYLEQPQFIFHDFWILFKKNFKQSIIIGIVDVAAIVGCIITIVYYPVIPEDDTATKVMFGLSTAAEVIFLMMNFYIYPQIAVLELKFGQIVSNSLILVFTNPLGEIIALACFVGYATLIYNFPLIMAILLPFVPLAWLAFISFFCCYPAVQKYLINPYYEKTGEKNPEIPDWLDEDESSGAVFEDSGGRDEPIRHAEHGNKPLERQKKSGGKVIR